VTFAQTPRPEYPRPQFERTGWVNLNGKWSYSFDFGQTGNQKGWTDSKGFDDNIMGIRRIFDLFQQRNR